MEKQLLLVEIIVSLLIGCAVLTLTAAITGTSIASPTPIMLGAATSLVSFTMLFVLQVFREHSAKLCVTGETPHITVKLAPESIRDLERIVRETIGRKEHTESMLPLLESIADLLCELSKSLKEPLSEKVVQVSEAIKRGEFEKAKRQVEDALAALSRETKE